MIVVGLLSGESLVYAAHYTVHIVRLDDLASVRHPRALESLERILEGTLQKLFLSLVICLIRLAYKLLYVSLLILACEDLPSTNRISIHQRRWLFNFGSVTFPKLFAFRFVRFGLGYVDCFVLHLKMIKEVLSPLLLLNWLHRL